MGFSTFLSPNSKEFAPLSGVFQGIGQLGGTLITDKPSLLRICYKLSLEMFISRLCVFSLPPDEQATRNINYRLHNEYSQLFDRFFMFA